MSHHRVLFGLPVCENAYIVKLVKDTVSKGVGPIAFFYNCVLPRCVLKRNRACTVAFKTQLDKIRLRFKRNRAKHSCVLNAKGRSPVAFF